MSRLAPRARRVLPTCFAGLDRPLSGLPFQSMGNLFADLSEPDTGEAFAQLLRCRNIRIERILSSDTPNPIRYEQDQDEWVLLLEGRATLAIAGETRDLEAGDYLMIPARTPHRVTATFPEPRCLWLVVHIFPQERP